VTVTATELCSLCGATLAEDQEWCLECGAARTTIRRSPDWRIPVLVIALVVIVVIGGFALALVRLTANAGPPASHPSARRAGATGPGGFATWGPGLDGWTVILTLHSTEQAALADARRFAAEGVRGLGVLSTNQHPAMRPANAWEVFAGRYPDQAAATAAASALARKGLGSVKATEVQRPGAP
jgi:hypothetical protein